MVYDEFSSSEYFLLVNPFMELVAISQKWVFCPIQGSTHVQCAPKYGHFQSTFCKYMSATLQTTVADYMYINIFLFFPIFDQLFLCFSIFWWVWIKFKINAKCLKILEWWNNLHKMISIEFSMHLIPSLKSSVHCLL